VTDSPINNAPIQVKCPACQVAMPNTAYFCSNCGKALRKQPPSTSLSKQATVYFVSFFIPPFGLWYAWQYLKQTDNKSRIIGWVAVTLTVVSIFITIWTTKSLLNSINNQLNAYNGLL